MQRAPRRGRCGSPIFLVCDPPGSTYCPRCPSAQPHRTTLSDLHFCASTVLIPARFSGARSRKRFHSPVLASRTG
jgi:hypothetical protein